jgi:putative ABC transport system substrate-binding protein
MVAGHPRSKHQGGMSAPKRDGSLRRRDFLRTIAAWAAWPLAARGQQPAVPVIGFLHSLSSNYIAQFAPGVRQGLGETGYVEGQNVAIEYRSAEGQYDRLPGLVADLLDRKVAVILAAGGSDPAKVAKAATSTIPIVFVSAADPVKAGLVASFNRPGGNVTGVSLIGSTLEAKRLEFLHQLVPANAMIGALVNPKYPDAELQQRELREAASVMKRRIDIVPASTDSEVESAFAAIAAQGGRAVLVGQDAFFNTRRQQLVTLAAHRGLPAIYNQREYVEIGGLMSYGTNFKDGYRQAGVLIGKILKGANPAEMPVMQPTLFELVINLKTAQALAITFPPGLLAIADEVIE